MIIENNEINYDKLISKEKYDSLINAAPMYLNLTKIDIVNKPENDNFLFLTLKHKNYDDYKKYVKESVLEIITAQFCGDIYTLTDYFEKFGGNVDYSEFGLFNLIQNEKSVIKALENTEFNRSVIDSLDYIFDDIYEFELN